MDLRIDAALDDAWVEFRDVRLTDDLRGRAQLRVRADDRVHRRPFSFDPNDLATFTREVRTLQASRKGHAILSAEGAPEELTIERDGPAWWLGGEVFDPADLDQRLHFRFAVAPIAVDEWVRALEAVLPSKGPHRLADDLAVASQAASVFPQVEQNLAAGSLTAAPQPPQRPGR